MNKEEIPEPSESGETMLKVMGHKDYWYSRNQEVGTEKVSQEMAQEIQSLTAQLAEKAKPVLIIRTPWADKVKQIHRDLENWTARSQYHIVVLSDPEADRTRGQIVKLDTPEGKEIDEAMLVEIFGKSKVLESRPIKAVYPRQDTINPNNRKPSKEQE